MAKAGKIIMIVSGVLFVLSVIATAVFGTNMGKAITDEEKSPIVANGEGSVNLEANSVYQLFAHEARDAGTCEITDPNGNTVDLQGAPSSTTTVTINDTTWSNFDGFMTKDAGEYEVYCEDKGDVKIGFPVSVTTAGGFGIFLLLAFLTFFTTIIGLVLWLIGRSRDKDKAAYQNNQMPGYPAAGAPYMQDPAQTPNYGGEQAQAPDYGNYGNGNYGTYGAPNGNPFGAPNYGDGFNPNAGGDNRSSGNPYA
ncbi:hypothetical protein [Corynebacterium aquatimens]|uniref:Flagellar basal body-associated protein FliL n=1 Tax=Corynebacterium aquatimens TaxID=1190508 RepID=A0A931GY41_9CORY|nr:hypothetical protein [Corynebacterium aquatimens]MBG6123239.1 flagellar basal body-associated protein FliL [Corynebacterium aquatimens]WJY66432.1 hypothetical protein CAQUA_08720 [Corynebacterium aquatimens]